MNLKLATDLPTGKVRYVQNLRPGNQVGLCENH